MCKKDEQNPANSVFYAVCRIYSGISYNNWQTIDNKLKTHWKPVRLAKEGPIDWHNYPPDVWIEPKNSLILQVNKSR